MIFRPINRDKYPHTVRGTGFGWGVLDTSASTPYIRAEFDTCDEAWDYAHALNRQHWLELDSSRQTYWAIQKACEGTQRPSTLNACALLAIRLMVRVRLFLRSLRSTANPS